MTDFASQNALDSALTAPVRGVLFDIDDTLVDLRAAMKVAMIEASRKLLPNTTDAAWDHFAELYMEDPQNYYDRFVAGEFSFAQQRGLRARLVFQTLGAIDFTEEMELNWISDFELAQPNAIQAFGDVIPCLDLLDAANIPYGAVSNNVYAYQRSKLDTAGLQRIDVLVGIDSVDAAKPDPRVFLEGCRLIACQPENTLYVGDNYQIDGVGSVAAGLQGIWLDRSTLGDSSRVERGSRADERGILSISSLGELPELVKANLAVHS